MGDHLGWPFSSKSTLNWQGTISSKKKTQARNRHPPTTSLLRDADLCLRPLSAMEHWSTTSGRGEGILERRSGASSYAQSPCSRRLVWVGAVWQTATPAINATRVCSSDRLYFPRNPTARTPPPPTQSPGRGHSQGKGKGRRKGSGSRNVHGLQAAVAATLHSVLMAAVAPTADAPPLSLGGATPHKPCTGRWRRHPFQTPSPGRPLPSPGAPGGPLASRPGLRYATP